MSAFLDENGKLITVSKSNPLPVEATNKALPVLSNTGTIGALNAYVEIAVPDNYKTASAIFTDGNISGSFEIQCSFDGAVFRPIISTHRYCTKHNRGKQC